MTTIRVAFALLAVCVLTVIDARPSDAANRPWCVQYQGSRGGALNCSFTSFQQCMMTGGPGTGGVCVQNPWYLWYGPNGQGTTGQGGRARRY
ncbi:MAG: DUF3551 domain-containing protein [Xanthobacteraceae bacterium]